MENKTNNPAQVSETVSEKKGGFKALLSSRKARHGSLAAAITVVVIAVVVVINIIVGLLVDRFPGLKLDLTSNNAYELHADTTDYLSHLSKDVNVYILTSESNFSNGNEYFNQAKNLLEKMVSCSNGRLSLSFVDTTADPTFINRYSDVDWTSNQNVAIVECGEQYKSLSLDDCFEYDSEAAQMGYLQYTGTTIEQAVVTSALNVTTENKIIVDFIKGSQESDYSALGKLLSDNAYQVNEINMLTDELDSDAAFTVLFAPAVDLDEDAAQKLGDWLENDGKYGRSLIFIPNAEATNTPNLEQLLSDWGMKLSDGILFETDGDHLLNGVSQYAFITDYTDYYKDNLKNPDIPVIAFQSRAVEITDESSAHAILTTSNRAGIFPYDADESWDYNDAIVGEPLAQAAESVRGSGEADSRIVVFGSESMFMESFLKMNSCNNSGYILNVFNTVSDKDDESVTIESKTLDNTELGVTDASTAAVAMTVFVIVIPLAVLVIGIIVWIRRRHL